MTEHELLQQALDALCMAVEPKKGKVYGHEFQPIDCEAMHIKAIEALRARLAQPEPEETIAKWIKANTEHRQWYICPKCSYQAPRFKNKWQGLTDYEVDQIEIAASSKSSAIYLSEAKLKEKNT